MTYRSDPAQPLAELARRITDLCGTACTPEEVAQAYQDGKLHSHRFFDLHLDRTHKGFHGLDRGVVFPPAEAAIPEYPHLPRTYHLFEGLQAHMKGPFRAEEKIDGFNVRVARVGDEVLAFSRGGYVCPFTTDRLADEPAIGGFLERYPELVVCLEVAGRGTPYNPEDIPGMENDIGFFVFDLMRRGESRILPPPERDRLLEGAGLPLVRSLGTHTAADLETLYQLLREVDARGGEGLVLKPEDPADGDRMKFVTPSSTLSDLQHTLQLAGDRSETYYMQRLVRYVYSLYELGGHTVEDSDALALGRTILEPLFRSISEVGADRFVEEEYHIRMRRKELLDQFILHLHSTSAAIQVLVDEEWQAEGYWHCRFRKRYQRASGFFESRLSGHLFVD